jgi:hypothetical protein
LATPTRHGMAHWRPPRDDDPGGARRSRPPKRRSPSAGGDQVRRNEPPRHVVLRPDADADGGPRAGERSAAHRISRARRRARLVGLEPFIPRAAGHCCGTLSPGPRSPPSGDAPRTAWRAVVEEDCRYRFLKWGWRGTARGVAAIKEVGHGRTSGIVTSGHANLGNSHIARGEDARSGPAPPESPSPVPGAIGGRSRLQSASPVTGGTGNAGRPGTDRRF